MAYSQHDPTRPRPDRRHGGADPAGSSAAVLTPPTGMSAVTPAPSPTRSIPAQRGPAGSPPPVTTAPAVRMCTCGHPEDAHDHYRSGTDCGACGAAGCGSFRPQGEPEKRNPLARLLRRR